MDVQQQPQQVQAENGVVKGLAIHVRRPHLNVGLCADLESRLRNALLRRAKRRRTPTRALRLQDRADGSTRPLNRMPRG